MVETLRPRDCDEERVVGSRWRAPVGGCAEMFIMSDDEVLRRAENVEMSKLWKGIDDYKRGYCVELKNPPLRE